MGLVAHLLLRLVLSRAQVDHAFQIAWACGASFVLFANLISKWRIVPRWLSVACVAGWSLSLYTDGFSYSAAGFAFLGAAVVNSNILERAPEVEFEPTSMHPAARASFVWFVGAVLMFALSKLSSW